MQIIGIVMKCFDSRGRNKYLPISLTRNFAIGSITRVSWAEAVRSAVRLPAMACIRSAGNLGVVARGFLAANGTSNFSGDEIRKSSYVGAIE
jgi:hypothetical protein